MFAVGSTGRGPRHFQRLVPVPNKSGLAKSTVTLAEALRAAAAISGTIRDFRGKRPPSVEYAR